MDDAKIEELKHFLDLCKSKPSMLHEPSLGFFKSYLESLGARIPPNTDSRSHMQDADSRKPNLSDVNLEDDIAESDIEFDESEVVEPDDDPTQKMGDPSVEVTEESLEAAQMSKSKAMDAISEGKLDEAIELLTEAILLNPSSAILYATRASVFVKMNKPKAAIRDADAALQINPDSAKGHKFRGIAAAMLGRWEEAAKDLHVASNLDFDEEIGSMLKKVEPNARKIEEHRRKYERLRKERNLKKAELEKQYRRPEAQATYERKEKRQQPSENKTSKQEARTTSSLNDGHVIIPRSASELDSKVTAASSLSRLLILYFTATWCGPCRFISPLYESLAGKHPKVVFIKIDIDQLGEVAARWNVNSVPTFFFIRNGKEIDKVVGADKTALESKIAQHAGQS